MTENEKDTTAAQLTWTAKKVWGTSGLTHYAELDGWKFTCDLPRKGGLWVVRGWGPHGRFFYREGITLAAVKAMAEDKKLTSCPECPPPGTGCPECGRVKGHRISCVAGYTV